MSALGDRLGKPEILRLLEASVGPRTSWARSVTIGFGMAIVLCALTGIGLSFTYAPSVASAWASVFATEYKLSGGFYVRSLHMVAAEAAMVLGALALVLAVFEGRYRGKRDLAFYALALAVGVTFAMAITGNPLRWDNRGYFGLVTEMNVAGELPGGKIIRALALGGTSPGNWTLSRMFALHAFALPLGLLALAWMGLRSSASDAAETTLDEQPVSDQLRRDAIFALLVTGVVAALAVKLRAPLEAPADPVGSYNARPEWYFQSLYVLRNAVPPSLQSIVAGSAPLLPALVVALLPRLDKTEKPFAKRLPFVLAIVLPVLGAVALTAVGLKHDAGDPGLTKARETQGKRDKRAVQVAYAVGVPLAGGLAMMQTDPISRAEDLFVEHCASCHALAGMGPADGKVTAPALDGFGTAAFAMKVLEEPDAHGLFGNTGYKGKMPSVTKPPPDPALAKDWKAMPAADVQAIVDFLAGEAAEEKAGHHARGAQLVKQRCTGCHLFRGETDDPEGLGPELAGWGSYAWVRAQIANPGTNATYRPGAMSSAIDGHMPRYDEKLPAEDIDLLTRFVRFRGMGKGR